MDNDFAWKHMNDDMMLLIQTKTGRVVGVVEMKFNKKRRFHSNVWNAECIVDVDWATERKKEIGDFLTKELAILAIERYF